MKYKKVCPVCRKIIRSSNGKPALETNYQSHMRTHKLFQERGGSANG